jgi:Mg-chelatase subunit ChlI
VRVPLGKVPTGELLRLAKASSRTRPSLSVSQSRMDRRFFCPFLSIPRRLVRTVARLDAPDHRPRLGWMEAAEAQQDERGNEELQREIVLSSSSYHGCRRVRLREVRKTTTATQRGARGSARLQEGPSLLTTTRDDGHHCGTQRREGKTTRTSKRKKCLLGCHVDCGRRTDGSS